MSRILKAYETRFRWLLQQVRARRLEQGVDWLVQKARRVRSSRAMSLADALTTVYAELAARPAFHRATEVPAPALFFCDAGLGGLARWLRAAGYDARWQEGIDDDHFLREARRLGATALTTDSMLMERRVLRDRLIPSLWLPPTLSIAEQLSLVFGEFGLVRQAARCMRCGGALRRVDKEAFRERIPPRTYRWLDEYFVCERCDQLFWHGTHWLKIQRQLDEVTGQIPKASTTDGHSAARRNQRRI
jgi:uncharacterized protein with PIN domain